MTGPEEGMYRCRAENVAGQVDVTAQLIIHSLPRVRLQPEGSVVKLTGSRLEVTCSVSGDPRPSIAWRRMSKTLTELEETSPTLVIERLTKVIILIF